MRHIQSLIAASTIIVAIAAPVASAQSNWVVWSQPRNSTYAIVPGFVTPNPPQDVEIADDFEVYGTIHRILVSGYDCFNCASPDVLGAFVRFYLNR
jgi:hypothetical protein